MIATASRSTGPAPDEAVRDWLLDERFPAMRRLALLAEGRVPADPDVWAIEATLARDPWVRPLLAGGSRVVDGRPVALHPYQKWRGAHWRLIALADLGVRIDIPGARAPIETAFEATVRWLFNANRARRSRPLQGRVRMCASQDGGAIWAASKLGLGEDPRVQALVERLIGWQWPDGGWNCDVRPAASHSSFNESWLPLAGLAAFRRLDPAGQVPGIDDAVDRAATFLLRHRVVESERTGALANPRVALLRWPPYWHYGLLPGLRALGEAGRLGDAGAGPALERLEQRRGADGRWRPDSRWWRPPGASSAVELVDWGPEGESRMLTLHARSVLAVR